MKPGRNVDPGSPELPEPRANRPRMDLVSRLGREEKRTSGKENTGATQRTLKAGVARASSIDVQATRKGMGRSRGPRES